MTCNCDNESRVIENNGWGETSRMTGDWERLWLESKIPYLKACEEDGSLIALEGTLTEGVYRVDDGEMVHETTWYQESRRECEWHGDECLCECCDPMDRNVVGVVQ
ncbi:hypothetical protein HOT75_gp132 [Gordonia phage Daredevil]|uniref:Uncharacterized protein n=1 Tax=Gordonia phage Daredevil TaxID=2283286 RepID=A0A345MIY7_9CAUD|nr:hypothetical protein HOT75_gp132 [Gordonia phage Daredevil]AXH70518.1 hypothetical protein SEA_DAREDEVIL_132 [Gordonia phage Daredevil]